NENLDLKLRDLSIQAELIGRKVMNNSEHVRRTSEEAVESARRVMGYLNVAVVSKKTTKELAQQKLVKAQMAAITAETSYYSGYKAIKEDLGLSVEDARLASKMFESAYFQIKSADLGGQSLPGDILPPYDLFKTIRPKAEVNKIIKRTKDRANYAVGRLREALNRVKELDQEAGIEAAK